MKSKIFFVCVSLAVAIMCVSCSSKKSGDDPVSVIKELSEKISKSSSEWEEAEWNEAAEDLEAAIDKLPSPLETQEKIELSSVLNAISISAGKHERKAAKVLAALKALESKLGDSSEKPSESSGLNGSYNFQGKIDKYPITMNFEIDGSKIKGSYYYDSKGPNAKLTLTGTCEDDELDINETDESGTPTGHFLGKLAEGVFKGYFITSKGKKLPFVLAESSIDISDISMDMDMDEELESSDIITEASGDISIDEWLDEYEQFCDRYVSFLKKMDRNDPTAMLEYAKLMKEASDYQRKAEKIEGDVSVDQLERINNINTKLMKAMQSMK